MLCERCGERRERRYARYCLFCAGELKRQGYGVNRNPNRVSAQSIKDQAKRDRWYAMAAQS